MRSLLSILGAAKHQMTLHTGTANRIPRLSSLGAPTLDALGASNTVYRGDGSFLSGGSVGQYTDGWAPWQGVKGSTGTFARNQDGNKLGGGALDTDPGAVNNEVDWDKFFAIGTWKIAMVHDKASYQGIATFQFDGVSQGTIDGYSAGTTSNNYTEVTGITVAADASVNFKLILATKNASASGYALYFNSLAIARTGA